MTTHMIANRIKTPDGTILHSKQTHHYTFHNDANGEYYFTDGGNNYIRRSVNKEPAISLDVTTESPWQEQREAFVWGTYGKSGTEKLKYVKLQDLTSNHIQAILNTQIHIPQWMRTLVFERELSYRSHNDLHIWETN